MYQVSSNTKCCMTCDYWQGDRKPNITIVTTENYMTPGKYFRRGQLAFQCLHAQAGPNGLY